MGLSVQQMKLRVMQGSRERKMERFYGLCDEPAKILDVGVAHESDYKPDHPRNYFLKHFRYDPEWYTALGIDDLGNMSDLFPGKTFVEYDGVDFPFEDNQFEWVFSNAVIEHVGEAEERKIHFVNEMCRVSRNVFFTTPNKYFPIEAHTNLFFVHWIDPLFYRFVKARPKHDWVNPDTVHLLSSADLEGVMTKSNATDYDISADKVYGYPMTFTVVVRS